MGNMKFTRKCNENIVRTEEEKEQMISDAAVAYGTFLHALGYDWGADPQTHDTPKRVAKAYVNDLLSGSIDPEPEISSFPNDEEYSGLICQTNIPVTSQCAHHMLAFNGVAHISYIPGKGADSMVVGLSKLNRIVDWYARRPQIQESLTKQIHDHVNRECIGNRGVAVVVEARHNCVACRGVRHDSIMKTSQLSGYYHTNEVGTRVEFFSLIDQTRV